MLLGAKWFDSRARAKFVASVADDDERALDAIDQVKAQKPTIMERRWVSVGWPSTSAGLWVVEYDTPIRGIEEKNNLLPSDAGKVL